MSIAHRLAVPNVCIALAAAALLAIVALTHQTRAAVQPAVNDSSANTFVNFTAPIAQLDKYSFGGTVSGYGVPWLTTADGQCANDQCAVMSQLGLGAYRVSVQWNNGLPVSAAGGNGVGGATGNQLVSSIRAAGAEPVLVIGGKGNQNDMDFTASDAANLAAYYSSGVFSGANAVTQFVIGNEAGNPNNGAMTMSQYCSRFVAAAQAMRQVNPAVKLIGPAWSHYNLSALEEFLRCAGNYVDVVDYHAYGRSDQGIDENIAASATLYEQRNRELRAAIDRIVPERSRQIAIQVGEYNVSPFSNDDVRDERFYGAGNAVWNALATGSIIKGGGRAYVFADQNNPIGLMFHDEAIAAAHGRRTGQPMPAYHGVGMFTGQGLFRSFGSTMVQTQTTDPDIVAYASANPRNIVLINKNRTEMRLAELSFEGFARGRASVWQTNALRPFDAPVNTGDMTVDGNVVYGLPPYSVTTLLLDE